LESGLAGYGLVVPLILAADTSDAYSDVERLFLPLGAAVFVLFASAILLSVLRGRRRTEASGREKNTPLEAAYALVLAITVAILVSVTFRADDRERSAQAGERVRVHVVAAKWRWRFEYPDDGVVVQGRDGEIPTLVVPAGTDVEFDAVSLDVDHGFWIPEMRFQRQLFPDRPARFALNFPKPGVLSSARCSFYCGLRHQDMRFTVRVLDPGAFRSWVAAQP
jgi:heme/copper-type cytochrome/quinol oxidase subunit 2